MEHFTHREELLHQFGFFLKAQIQQKNVADEKLSADSSV